ncbi:MAG: hypothetical protein VX938_10615, partial [Myxococcota bacterium]|nr:hypothetical protein [Myxococcota bacterium]
MHRLSSLNLKHPGTVVLAALTLTLLTLTGCADAPAGLSYELAPVLPAATADQPSGIASLDEPAEG